MNGSKLLGRAALFLAFCRTACVSAGEPTAAKTLSPEQVNTEIREPIERLTHRPTSEPASSSDGKSVVLDLEGGLRYVTMVSRNPDGSHTTICTNSADDAVRFMLSPPAPTTAER